MKTLVVIEVSFLLRKRYITSLLLLLFFTVSYTIAQEQEAALTTDKDDSFRDEWVIEPGFTQVIPASDYEATYFMAALIINVTINASSFCGGNPVKVSYTFSNSPAKFDNNNIFTAQLSNASGSFSSPVIIGTLQSKQSGVINATIPIGTPNGAHYRIRVVSSSPVITSIPNGTDLTINVTPTTPALVNATPPAICAGASSNLKATSAGNSIRWYTTQTGGSLLGASASGANFSVTPATTTIYYAESLNAAGCSSSERTAVTVTVNSIPTITSTSPGSVCGNGTVTLTAASSAGTINWYSEATGGVILGTGISFTTPIINFNTTYYVDATANGCVSATRTPVYATVYPAPTPMAGTITQPTCAVSTGSVVLNGLPATGTWTLTRTPGGSTTTGTGTSTTITGLAAGTYTFTVMNTSGCISTASINIVINAAPGNPSAPIAGGITQPTCTVSTGSVVLNGLPATGTWTLTRTPGGSTTTGTGTTTTITGLSTGTHTFTVTNTSGCISPASGNVVINTTPGSPSAPIGGGITQPTCAVSTGSVVLNGLPATGTWTLTRTPGGTTTSGTGTGTTITGLAAGTYTFTVTNTAGCISTASGNVVINTAPGSPSAPIAGGTTQPTCAASTGSVVLNGLPATGTWTLTRTPGGTTTSGTGTATTITGLAAGNYSFTVTNTSGCISPASGNVVINTTPGSPSAPIAGGITQPTCAVSTGSVVLNGLPATGTWTLTRTPGGTTTMGTGTGTTINGLPAGTYTFTVANASGCFSKSSENVLINVQAAIPTANAGNGGDECDLSFKFSAIASIGTGKWTQTSGTGTSTFIPDASTANATVTVSVYGNYTFAWTETNGACSKMSIINVNFYQPPVANAGPDQVLEYPFETTLNAAALGNGQTGEWTLISGTGEFADRNDYATLVSKLSPGKNSFKWTLTAGVCPSSSDIVSISVNNRIIPTLITPNNDGANDFFIINGLETLGKTELVIFNRWGVRIYTNDNYDNNWNGVDNNMNPLADDTYFFVSRSENGKHFKGYIVIIR